MSQPKPLRVRVTAKDIAQGKQCDGERCPLALAVGRATGLPLVAGNTCFFDPRGSLSIDYSRRVHRFLCDFDLGEPVAPFSFMLQLPR